MHVLLESRILPSKIDGIEQPKGNKDTGSNEYEPGDTLLRVARFYSSAPRSVAVTHPLDPERSFILPLILSPGSDGSRLSV